MTKQKMSVAGFLPDLELPSPSRSIPVSVRAAGGKTTVLVTLHSADCPGCLAYLAGFAHSDVEFKDWDARLLLATPAALETAAKVTAPFGTVLADEHKLLADGSSASAFVADRYGQIFHMAVAGASHELPSPGELAEWLKYLGTLCPE